MSLTTILDKVNKGDQYDIFTIKGDYYKIRDIKTFYQEFLKIRQDIHYALSYTNQAMKSGLTIDSDLYIPCDVNKQPIDLNIDRKNITELAQQIQLILDKYLIQNVTYNKLSSKQLEYVILERHGPNTKKTNEDTDLNKYVRFGFHIYFNNIRMSVQDKKILAQLIRQDIKPYFEKQVQYYKTTPFGEFIDTNPFYGTTSLPLTWNDDTKRYSYLVENGQQAHFHNLERLDPFNGDDVCVNPQFITEVRPTNILSLLNQKLPFDYQQSLLFVYRELQKKINNQQLMNLLIQFGHIQWQYREEFVTNLYYYLNRNQYLTELGYYIAMADCMQDIIEQSTYIQGQYEQACEDQLDPEKRKDIQEILQWENSTQDRYPYKINSFVEKIARDNKGNKDQTYLIKKLIKCYNKNLKTQQESGINLDKEEMGDTSGIYDEFLTWKNCKWSGILRNTPLEIIGKQEFKSLFTKYINIKLQQTLRCYKETEKDQPQIYEFNNNSQQTYKDQFHYKYIDKLNFVGKVKQFYDDFLDDYCSVQGKNRQLKENVVDLDENDPAAKKQKITAVDTFVLMLNSIQQNIKPGDYDNALSDLQMYRTSSPDQEEYYFGVYNGVLYYDKILNKFKFLQNDDARDHFITRTTMFNVPDWLVDDQGYLIDIDKFSDSKDENIRKIYDAYVEIKRIYDEIFMDQIEVFQWKISEIIKRLIYKNKTTKCIFVTKCTGSGGKTCQGQPLMVWLGQREQEKVDMITGQKRKISQGYSGQPKSCILQTAMNNSSQHDTGGYTELYGAAYAMLSELSNAPIINAQIKNLCGDTQISCREIFSPNVRQFQNKAFMELQTNDQLHFEAQYDYGTQRRIYPFTFTKKFVDEQIYNSSTDPNKDRNLGIKREGLIEKLCNNFDYIDAGNIYMLKTFLEWPHKDEDGYIPQVVKNEQRQLFQEYNPWLIPFNTQFLQQSENSYIPYQGYIEQLRFFVKEKNPTIKDSQIQKMMENYDYLAKEHFINNLQFLHYDTQEFENININKFDHYLPLQNQGLIIIKGYQFKDQQIQDEIVKRFYIK